MPNMITIENLVEAIRGFGESGELFYLASPYSSYAEGMHQAAEDAAKVTNLLLDRGLIVISPIVHGHHVDLWSLAPKSHQFWMRQCLTLLPRCRGLIVATLAGWDRSAGVTREIEVALSRKIPVFYMDCDGLI